MNARIKDKAVIDRLVELVDQLRRPYMNTRHDDLYWLATNALNELEEKGTISPLDFVPCTPPGWPTKGAV
jgi:hypothetical protein